MKTRQELKRLAKEAMGSQRSTAILIMLLLCIKVWALGILLGIVARWLGRIPFVLLYWVGILALLVIAVNVLGEYIKIYRGEPARIKALYTDLKVRSGRKLGGMLWMVLWIVLWALISIPIVILAVFLMRRFGRGKRLLVLVILGPVHLAALIPVFIKSLSYFMTPYILADCPDVTARGALKLSKQMMAGRKGELFVLMLSFIGWLALSVLTFGILFVVYVGPYMYTTYAGFYATARAKALADMGVAADAEAIEAVTDAVELAAEAEDEAEAVEEVEVVEVADDADKVEVDVEVEADPEEEVEVEIVEEIEAD